MSDSNRYKEWEKDFVEYLTAPDASVPAQLSASLTEKIQKKLSPSPWTVFLKLVCVVLVAGSASLLACPQNGFGKEMGLMEYFMEYGEVGCRALCGAFFMLCCMSAACVALRFEELRALRQVRFLSVSAITALSLGVFSCTSPTVEISAAFIWFLGATAVGVVTLEVGVRVRSWILSSHYAQA